MVKLCRPRERGRIQKKSTFEFLWFFNVPRGQTLIHGTARLTSPSDGHGQRDMPCQRTQPVYHSDTVTEARTRDLRIQSPVSFSLRYQVHFRKSKLIFLNKSIIGLPVEILTLRISEDSVLICRGPYLVPDLFEVPISRGIPTKHASSPKID